MKQHVLDEIALVKTFRFPKITEAFVAEEPLPEQHKNLLLWRMALESWQEQRLQHSQSDYSQYLLITPKLEMCDSQIIGGFRQLTATMETMSKMISSLVTLFDPIATVQLQLMVNGISQQIKDIVSSLQNEQGIIIKDIEKVKLSPLFVENMIKQISPVKSGMVTSPTLTRIGPQLVETLLAEFISNAIHERKRNNQQNFAERRRTWKR